jgi:hypothetical protein
VDAEQSHGNTVQNGLTPLDKLDGLRQRVSQVHSAANDDCMIGRNLLDVPDAPNIDRRSRLA